MLFRLKELRQRYGYSQAQLSRKVGIEPSQLSEWERGVKSPTLTSIERIAEALGASIHDLVDEGPRYCALRGDVIMDCGHPQSAVKGHMTQWCGVCAKMGETP